jgi:WD40 repeat protein
MVAKSLLKIIGMSALCALLTSPASALRPDIVGIQAAQLITPSVAFSPDGKILATGSAYGAIKLWSVSDGKYLRTLTMSGSETVDLAFSPDGQKIAGCFTRAGIVRIWRVQDGQLLQTISGTTFAMSFSPDGQYLATNVFGGSGIKIVKLSDSQVYREISTLNPGTLASEAVISIDYSPDGELIAGGTRENNIWIWKVQTGELLHVLKGHAGKVTSVSYTPNGQSLLSASEDGSIRIWRVAEGIPQKAHVFGKKIQTASLSPDGSFYAFGAEDGTIGLWRYATDSKPQTFKAFPTQIYSVAFSPDGQTLASGSETWWGSVPAYDKAAKIWKVPEGELIRSIGDTASIIDARRKILLSPSGQRVLIPSVEEKTAVWDVSSGSVVFPFETPGELLAVTPDNKAVALFTFVPGDPDEEGTGGHLVVRNLADGAVISDVTLGFQGDSRFSAFVYGARFSPDGKILAVSNGTVSATDGNVVLLIRVSDGTVLHQLTGHSNRIYHLEFTQDGQTLATGAHDSMVNLWRVSSGELLHSLPHPAAIQGVQFLSDSKTLQTLTNNAGPNDQAEIWTWKVEDGSYQNRVKLSQRIYPGAAFTADGKALLSRSNVSDTNQENSLLNIWRVSDGQLLHTYDEETDPSIVHFTVSQNNRYFAYIKGDQSTVVARNPLFIAGDADEDAKVDVNDAVVTLRSVVGVVELTPLQKAMADYNEDETVDVRDTVGILRKTVGLE